MAWAGLHSPWSPQCWYCFFLVDSTQMNILGDTTTPWIQVEFGSILDSLLYAVTPGHSLQTLSFRAPALRWHPGEQIDFHRTTLKHCCYYHLRQLQAIRRSVSSPVFITIVHTLALITGTLYMQVFPKCQNLQSLCPSSSPPLLIYST